MDNIDIIKMLCKERGLTIAALERILGFGNGSLSKANKIPADRIQTIAKYFGVTMEFIMTGENSDFSYPNDELNDYLEELRRRPEMKMLFSTAKGATKEDVEKAVKIIEALKGNND